MKNTGLSWDLLTDSDEYNSTDEDNQSRFYGVVRGTVIDPTDLSAKGPLGQVRVKYSFMDMTDLSAWAPVISPMAGLGYGFYFMPLPGTEVVLAFDHGNINKPYVLGCLWTAVARPPLPSPIPQIRALRTIVGNQIVFTEGPPSVTIQSGPTPPGILPSPPAPVAGGMYTFQTISMTPDGINMVGNSLKVLSGGTPPASLTVTPAGITLQAGGSSIAVTPAGIVIVATNITIFGSAGVLIN
jgi:hypothetical protein